MATVSSKAGTSSPTNLKPTKTIKPGTAATKAPATATTSLAQTATAPPIKNPYTTAPPATPPAPPPQSTTKTSATANPDAITGAGGSQSVVNGLNTIGADPINHGYNQATTTPLNGAIGGYGYTPLGAGTLYDNPQALATDILKSMGIENPGLANSLSQTLDPAVAAQFLLNNGKNSSDAETLNFANQYMQNMVTPGGRTVDFSSLMDHLLGAGGQYANGKADNALAAYLNAGLDPSQQVRAAQGLMGQSMTGQNPYFQQGFSNYAKDLGSSYQGAMAKANPGYTSFIDYLNKQSGIGNWG